MPEAIHVLFVYVTAAGGQGLAVAWDGAESQALRLLEVDGPRLRDVLTASRYWAPQ